MEIIITDKYTLKPSDSDEWVIIRSPAGLEIDTELSVLDYHYDCIPKKLHKDGKTFWCSQLCCYAGCYISPREIGDTAAILKDIKPLLQTDGVKRIEDANNIFWDKNDFDEEEDLYKTYCAPEEWEYDEDEDEDAGDEEDEEPESEEDDKPESEEDDEELGSNSDENDEDEPEEVPPKNHCVFLMENGLCATHKHFVDHGENWVQKKFNICVTFPLDIRPQDKTLAFMDEFDSFAFAEVDCISHDEDKKKALGMPQIIDSMKYAIVDRYGEEWWCALAAVAKDHRANKINIAALYEE